MLYNYDLEYIPDTSTIIVWSEIWRMNVTKLNTKVEGSASSDSEVDDEEWVIQTRAIMKFYDEVMDKFHIVMLTSPEELWDHVTLEYKTLNYSTY